MGYISLVPPSSIKEDFQEPSINYSMSSSQTWGPRFGCRSEKITPTKISLLFSMLGSSDATNHWQFILKFNQPSKPYSEIVLGNTIGIAGGENAREYIISQAALEPYTQVFLGADKIGSPASITIVLARLIYSM